MRQRLALAAALLKDPALLILDEPANGLDPAGMRSVRELLRRLAAEGRTVFVSSHLLSEIQQTCDRVAILSRGRCVTQGTVAEVSAARGPRDRDARHGRRSARRRSPSSTAPASRPSAVTAICACAVAPSEAARISRTLGEQGHWVRELRPDERSLEDLFLELTTELGERQRQRCPEARGGRRMNLLVVEMRRAMRRRVVRVLIVLALVGCASRA